MKGPWAKSCDECQAVREMGAAPDPDPCGGGCVLESFGPDAGTWFNIWASCVEKWTDPKTKQVSYGMN